MLRLSDFDYYLPKELIAQYPASCRDESRLMILQGEEIKHSIFKNLGNYLESGDLLVFNNAKVIPARLKGRKLNSGGKLELLLLKEMAWNCWEVLIRRRRHLNPGLKIFFEGTNLLAEVIEKKGEGKVIIKFDCPRDIKKILWKIGKIPLPPYIKREVEELDYQRYQTIFAESEGAVAAPTAGLHFTTDLMARLKMRGIDFTFLTLKVGWGTFNPIRSEDLTQHRMEGEFFFLSPETAQKINLARQKKCRIIAVGTTTVRVLETLAKEDGKIAPGEDWTELFIYPGYKFKIVDGLITNFHLPRTTLLLLVSAFFSREKILEAYTQAIQNKYRFYSYGDAMLIFKDS